jgi:Hydrazine synthase alpha subunit middle domain
MRVRAALVVPVVLLAPALCRGAGIDLQARGRAEYRALEQDLSDRPWFARVASQAFRREALVLPADRDPLDVVLRRTRALGDDLRKTTAAERLRPMGEELARLEARAGSVPVSDTVARRALFDAVRALRRRIAFANPLLNFDRVVLATHHFSAFDHMCDQYYGCYARPGGGLVVLEQPFGPAPRAHDLLAGAVVSSGRRAGQPLGGGSFLAPALSYDGKTVLFAYAECGLGTAHPAPRDWQHCEWSPGLSYHLFRVNVDGTDLTQLTDGPWSDLHPCWLPDGQVVFTSERRGGFLRCSGERPCPLYTLHAMDARGGDLVRLSSHESHEWHPSVDHDGQIVYTRWDYVDRGGVQAHNPWVTTPDGRNPRAIQGNYKKYRDAGPDMEVNVRAIPGARRYVATAAPHHGQAYGSFIVIDPEMPDDDAMASVRRLTPEVGFPEIGGERAHGPLYGTAWPLSEDYYLCVHGEGREAVGVTLLDSFGNKELLFQDDAVPSLGPVPLAPRPVPPVVPSLSSPARLGPPAWKVVGDGHPLDATAPGVAGTAEVVVANVHDSQYPLPDGVKVRALRVMQVLPKTTPVHQLPWIGYGRETSARAVLGTVPVEDDGSAYFRLPAGRPVFFQALDERGRAVLSMRSATYVHGGERLTCTGCHEGSSRSPATLPAPASLQALRRGPSPILPEPDGSNPFSFARLVQPVLDRQCVSCHDGKPARAPDLRAGNWSADPQKWFTSYRNLRPYAFHLGADGPGYDAWMAPRSVAGGFGARASRLLPLLEQGHHGVALTPEELRRITVWLDANSDFFGAYENLDAQARGEVVRPSLD